ncbi:Uncharacterised protein [Klebsiella pneumoniae]|nr:Uncharacterised protein [Klebsiella pneumoniae]
MAQVALALVQRAQQRVTLQMASLSALQHLRHALLELIASLNNTRHQRWLLLRQRRLRKLLQRVAQGHLRLLQALGFTFILERPDHLREPHRRRCHAGGVAGQVHAAGHVVQRLLLDLLLDLAGVAEAEHRHAAHHQRHGDHQQIENQQAASGAGEERGA